MRKPLAAVVEALADAPAAAPDHDRAAEVDHARTAAEIEIFDADAERLYARKVIGHVDHETPIGALVVVYSDKKPDVVVPGFAIAWVPTIRS